MAQLSFADLIERRVPLTTAEATSLTLAAAERGPVPDANEIFLSSTGAVSFGPHRVLAGDESTRLASLLHQLLLLDAADGAERRGRVPGGLLVVLARTMRQIDLPALTTTAFRDALTRFGARAEPGMLAAIFWRAARMRTPDRPGLAGALSTLTPPRRRSERRSQGPAPAELRRWLRQAERDVFRLRQSRAAAASAAVIATFVVMVSLLVGLDLSDSPSPARASTDLALESQTTRAEPMPMTTAPARVTDRPPRASVRPRVPQPPRGRRTVEMVNLPRTPWVVVRSP